MKNILKKALYTIISLAVVVLIIGLVLAFLPMKPKSSHVGITRDEATLMRQNYKYAHQLFTTTDGETLFLRRWNPDTLEPSKKDIAILIFHGITAHSGAYNMAGQPISAGGYTTFGLDYRGHGLSGGNRGDSPNKERWLADLTEAIQYIKGLGFPKVIVLGHSLGVASAIYATKAIPNEISGLILLSGAYEGKKGVSAPPTLFEKSKIIASSVVRPSVPVVEYFREGMTGINDSLFNFKYTLRFLSMLNVKELRLPLDLNIPVLVGVGDKDELFEVDKVKELYDAVPGNKKEFLVMHDTYHAKIPAESWQQLVVWLDKSY